jgi:hypothetical protein
LAAALIIVSRKPDVVFHAQFWAEGGDWYAEAYNFGFAHTLFFLTDGGYFQLFPKLVTGMCLLVPLQFAPLLMNICGIAIQALPVVILLSARCSEWGSLSVRLYMALVYLALPNSWEIDVVINCSQYHLALAACLLAFAKPPSYWQWKAFDVSILFLSGLTGPFCVVLLPLLGLFWWMRRQSWSGILFGILLVSSTIQMLAFILTGLHLRDQPLGATPLLFAKILSGNVYASALIGKNHVVKYAGTPAICAIGVCGTAILLYCSLKARLELRLFIVFCAGLFAASLISPQAAIGVPQWEILLRTHGCRYWFLPMLAFLWALIWCATDLPRGHGLKVIAMVALSSMIIGVKHDWRYPHFADQRFPDSVNKFASSPAGTAVIIPICPKGYAITLIKKL